MSGLSHNETSHGLTNASLASILAEAFSRLATQSSHSLPPSTQASPQNQAAPPSNEQHLVNQGLQADIQGIKRLLEISSQQAKPKGTNRPPPRPHVKISLCDTDIGIYSKKTPAEIVGFLKDGAAYPWSCITAAQVKGKVLHVYTNNDTADKCLRNWQDPLQSRGFNMGTHIISDRYFIWVKDPPGLEPYTPISDEYLALISAENGIHIGSARWTWKKLVLSFSCLRSAQKLRKQGYIKMDFTQPECQ
ncbi:uncharacterized protein J4E88_000112 [Alternaria novae-zelandiae]|uniref:uncharacterized protein n=1 Tax=Alternaria novae-zelandiae TaxID=430562 RepID=UPI0020C3F708|nr:uncharacterized protein J4E88_000112 [Alternaria novae-zelandiae]KAI4695942.1 hypothetical protein J4E88_000112 [Alternaria novae-zelandiae]